MAQMDIKAAELQAAVNALNEVDDIVSSSQSYTLAHCRVYKEEICVEFERFVGAMASVLCSTGLDESELDGLRSLQKQMRALKRRLLVTLAIREDEIKANGVSSSQPEGVTEHLVSVPITQSDTYLAEQTSERQFGASTEVDTKRVEGTSTSANPNHTTKVYSASKQSTITSHRLTRTTLPIAGPGECHFCQGKHIIGNCESLLALAVKQRYEQLKNSNLCFTCLSPGHSSKGCEANGCDCCRERHHVLLCYTAEKEASRQISTDPSNVDDGRQL